MRSHAETSQSTVVHDRRPAASGTGGGEFADCRDQAGALARLDRLAQRSAPAAQLRALQQMADAAAVPAAHRRPPNDTGLPSQLKAGVEALSGLSLDPVRVHYNSAKPAQLNAHAYTQGNEIHVAPGQERHLPHEAWHVVQQAQGRVRPTLRLKGGVPVNDDAGLEREADAMGARAVASGAVPSIQMSCRTDPICRSRHVNVPPLQFIAVGMIPQTPNNWRHYVTLDDNGASGTRGNVAFSNAQKDAVRADNIAAAAGNAPVLAAGAGNYPASDSSQGALLTRQEATNFSPEVDHVVPQAERGANDYANARVLSQGENNGAQALVLGRPGRANQRMRAYQNLAIDRDMNAPQYVPNNKQIAAGDLLTLNDIKSLARYAGQAVPASYADIANGVIDGIAAAGPGNQNDVTVA